jgi:hypothetical protein
MNMNLRYLRREQDRSDHFLLGVFLKIRMLLIGCFGMFIVKEKTKSKPEVKPPVFFSSKKT